MTHSLEIASKFINNTKTHVFLTGKAGTGKTTFLRKLTEKTHKNFAVVAPTGIAALNAKGVTIHSQFLLPLGTFIPVNEPVGNYTSDTQAFTQNTLARNHPLNNVRRQVLRHLDVLIIDEVSMLRADILDAIDYRLKAARGNFSESFGGVQLLLIGDLFQLSPIIRNTEWKLLRPHYQDGFFYESLALKQAGFAYIELEKVFRQEDENFIQVLNNLRNNTVSEQDIEVLNQYHKKESENGIITLTTHNRVADSINENELEKLKGDEHTYHAFVSNDFPKSMFPVNEIITLKKGTRVMFIKNDSTEGKYFNGKLATVLDLTDNEVTVKMDGESDTYKLKKETWENKRYTINTETKEQEEEVLGNFTQYPIKLAWAITIHKSQGLTFEKAAIDVGEAFAPGQVYVALSRLKSLDGLRLTTPIQRHVIQTDNAVTHFSKQQKMAANLAEQLQLGQRKFVETLLQDTFTFYGIVKQINYTLTKNEGKLEFEETDLGLDLDAVKTALLKERNTCETFKKQLVGYLYHKTNEELLERVKKGSNYYTKLLMDLMEGLLKHIGKVRQFSKTKTYIGQCIEIDQLLYQKICEMGNSAYFIQQILQDKEIEKTSEKILVFKEERDRVLKETGALKNIDTAGKTSGRKKKSTESKPKKPKGQTYQDTLDLLNEGFSLEEVAKKRELTASTVEGHIAKLVGLQKISIHNYLKKDAIARITLALKETEGEGSKACYEKLDGTYSYNQIRMVQAHLSAAELEN